MTTAKAKKGLSYVLGDASANENHILPINAMQFSASRNVLYTGGRDGLVKCWNAPANTSRLLEFTFGNGDKDDSQDLDERLLRLETAISSNPLLHRIPQTRYDAGMVRNYNIHFDWINDLKLVNNDRSLVTALADLSLKLIDLDGDDSDVHKFRNVHTDYIKKISSIAPHNLVVSGGLDGSIVVWDLETLKPVQQFQNCSASPHSPRSVYALSNNHLNLISTGGPNNTINIYDRRIDSEGQSNLIRRLVGHQDNVRCLLMNGNFILSGSSDTTVKLWDMRNFKVYKNFEVHDEPVWSLTTPFCSGYASESDFSVFYSGDKGGNIVKTDLGYLSSNSHLHDSEVFPTAVFLSSDIAFIDEKVGLCTLVAKSDSPIVSLCAEGDSSLFASTYTSLDRYYIPESDPLAKYQYLRACVDHSMNMEHVDVDDLSGVDGAPSDQSDINSDFYDIVSHLSMDSANLEILSSLSATNFSAAGNIPDEELVSTDYTSMFLNTNGGPSLEFVNAYKDELAISLDSKQEFDETPVEILLNPVPPSSVLSIPFNRKPFQFYQISPKSIISKRMFNNKRCLLTLYLNGDIKIWDVLICKETKFFPFANNQCPLSKDDLKERTKEFDSIYQEYQTLDTLNNWCEVEIKSGKLLVSLTESTICNVDIYYDDLVKSYPFLSTDHPDNAVAKGLKTSPDDRFPIARIFMNSIFQKYALYELAADLKLREELQLTKANPKVNSGVDAEQRSIASTDSKRKKLFTRKSSKNSIPQSTLRSPSLSIASNMSEFANAGESAGNDNSPPPEDSIAKILQMNKQVYLDKYNIHGPKKLVNTSLNLYTNNPELHFHDTEVLYKPVIDSKRLPGHLLIIVFETSADLGNYREVCSFHLDELNSLQFPAPQASAKEELVKQLRCTLPRWIGLPILYDKFPHKELPKISFQLMEIDYLTLPPERKIGGRSQKKIKKLPSLESSESSIKLSSQNMLRVNKILKYLVDKFDLRTSEMKDKRPPSEWLVLECRGQELSPSLTLQTIKTKIWKSSSDIELRFRRKFDA
ncbi:CIC11C00000001371 [Sungouiella intermedia]|uniref:CIC11C00000001371 n=1 Tax=Sungouiella intermedia TaxID=45354 RepID=A0A1L0BUL6_9ASCO|nr:CIC11C00000001371 [[Candida] intermedia]